MWYKTETLVLWLYGLPLTITLFIELLIAIYTPFTQLYPPELLYPSGPLISVLGMLYILLFAVIINSGIGLLYWLVALFTLFRSRSAAMALFRQGAMGIFTSIGIVAGLFIISFLVDRIVGLLV